MFDLLIIVLALAAVVLVVLTLIGLVWTQEVKRFVVWNEKRWGRMSK